MSGRLLTPNELYDARQESDLEGCEKCGLRIAKAQTALPPQPKTPPAANGAPKPKKVLPERKQEDMKSEADLLGWCHGDFGMQPKEVYGEVFKSRGQFGDQTELWEAYQSIRAAQGLRRGHYSRPL